MAQLLVLYNTPADPAAFDRYYNQTPIPLAQKIPGLRSYVISGGPVQALAGDPQTIQDHATFDKPMQYATGVSGVWVNGVAVFRDGEHTGAKPGRVVRRER